MNERAHPSRIAIVGLGNVGATYAYAALLNRLSAEIVLIDGRRDKAEGEAMDLIVFYKLIRPVINIQS